MGVPATGKQISFGGINLFRLEDGKVWRIGFTAILLV